MVLRVLRGGELGGVGRRKGGGGDKVSGYKKGKKERTTGAAGTRKG